MASDTTTSHEQDEKAFDQNLGSIETALEQARSELASLTEAASIADQLADDSDAEYSLHEVQGVGRYAVVRRTGWRALLKVIHDLSANIDFSTKQYPGFDGIIGEQFKSPYLLDPLDEKYESYRDLRDNIAAVRNFLMETYYVDTPPGMTPEKAKQALNEIATFVGKGLNNNYLFMGLIHNHHISKPFISIHEASRPGGAGAQYIYERILEMHRQSNWMRPFSAVLSLFGGHTPPDWMLPPAYETEFTQLIPKDIATDAPPKGPPATLIAHVIDDVNALEAKRAHAIDQHQISNTAYDLSSLGDQLLHSASNMQNVAALSEPTRRDAIEIAKDILRKLRASLGDKVAKDGLNLPPKEDMATFGSLKGVALIYERMIGWARAVDPGIMRHPSVVSGVEAIGQLGYLAKMEAMKMAKLAGNTKLVEEIGEQLAKVPPAYSARVDAKISSLLDRIEAGMNTLLSRVQTISGPGASIGNAPGRDVGQTISQPPTAGMAQQVSNSGKQDDAALKNAEMLAAQNAFKQAQQARINQQTIRASQTITSNAATQTTSAPPPQQSRGQGRSPFQQNRPVPQRASTAAAPPGNPQQQPRSPIRNPQADAARAAKLQQDQRDEDARQRAMIDMQRQQAQKAAAKSAARRIDANMLKGFQTAVNTQGMGPVVAAKKPVAPPAQSTTKQPQSFVQQTATKPPSPDDKNQLQPIGGPNNRGGRGF